MYEGVCRNASPEMSCHRTDVLNSSRYQKYWEGSEVFAKEIFSHAINDHGDSVLFAILTEI